MARSRIALHLAVAWFVLSAAGLAAKPAQGGFLLELVRHSTVANEARDSLAPRGEAVVRVVHAATGKTVLERSVGLEKPVPVLVGAGKYHVSVKSEEWWSTDRRIEVSQGSEPVRLTMNIWSTGTIGGRVIIPDGEVPTDGFHARFEPAVSSAAASEPRSRVPVLPSGTVPCSLEERRVACRLPSGEFDLHLAGGKLAPLYFWGVDVQPKGLEDLGELRFVRGASVAGRVLDRDTRAPVEEGLVELRPTGATFDPDAENRKRSTRRSHSARTDERGHFHLTGIPEAAYRVWISREGYATAPVSSLELVAGREHTFEEPLLLGRPTTLEILLTPPLDPYGERWKIGLNRFRRGSRYQPVPDVPRRAGFGGTWEVKGLRPGRYLLTVGNSLDPRWYSQRFEVGSERRQLLGIDLDFVAIDGNLTLGGEPLTGTLWFGGRHGVESIRFDADREGEFRGYLPREGEWEVDLARFGKPGVRSLEAVRVKKPSGTRTARVEIALPDTVVRGRVVDADGNSQPGARLLGVDMREGRRELMELADDRGEFELRGLEPGPLSIQAESAAGASSWVPVEVVEGRDSPELVLRIVPSRVVSGRVVSPSGPVPDATVKVVPSFTGKEPVRARTVVTRVDGAFDLELPEHVRHATVLVFPPGFAAKMFSRTFGKGNAKLNVGVEADGGTLELGLAAAQEDARASGLLMSGGAVVGVEQLLEWARMHGGGADASAQLRIRSVQSGNYRLCSRSFLAPGDDRKASQCDEGFLPAGGALSLNIQQDQETTE